MKFITTALFAIFAICSLNLIAADSSKPDYGWNDQWNKMKNSALLEIRIVETTKEKKSKIPPVKDRKELITSILFSDGMEDYLIECTMSSNMEETLKEINMNDKSAKFTKTSFGIIIERNDYNGNPNVFLYAPSNYYSFTNTKRLLLSTLCEVWGTDPIANIDKYSGSYLAFINLFIKSHNDYRLSAIMDYGELASLINRDRRRIYEIARPDEYDMRYYILEKK